MANEHTFIRRIHKEIISPIYYWKIRDDYAGGVPDAWYCGTEGRTLFVEYKYVAVPKRPQTLVKAKLSTLQYSWLRERQCAGVPVWVIIGSAKGGAIFYDLEEAKRGISKAQFLERVISCKMLARRITRTLTTGTHTHAESNNNAA